MERTDEIVEILKEIRAGQREQLEQYKTATQRSIELQQRAVNRAENIGRLYRVAVAVSAILIVGIIALIFYLLNFIRR
jgi:hypothetical protein